MLQKFELLSKVSRDIYESKRIERYGNFLVSVVENTEALNCFKSAHMSYVQWGALALADNVWKKYNLDQDASNDGIRFSTSNNKHGRSW